MELSWEAQASSQRRQQQHQAQLPGAPWGEGGSAPAGAPPSPSQTSRPTPSHTHPGQAGRGACSAPAGLLVKTWLVRMRPPPPQPQHANTFHPPPPPPGTLPVHHRSLQQPQRLLGGQRPPPPARGWSGWEARVGHPPSHLPSCPHSPKRVPKSDPTPTAPHPQRVTAPTATSACTPTPPASLRLRACNPTRVPHAHTPPTTSGLTPNAPPPVCTPICHRSPPRTHGRPLPTYTRARPPHTRAPPAPSPPRRR